MQSDSQKIQDALDRLEEAERYMREKALAAAEAAAEARNEAKRAASADDETRRNPKLETLVKIISLIVTLSAAAIVLYVSSELNGDRQKLSAQEERIASLQGELDGRRVWMDKVSRDLTSVIQESEVTTQQVKGMTGSRRTAEDAARDWAAWRREYEADKRFFEERHGRLADKVKGGGE